MIHPPRLGRARYNGTRRFGTPSNWSEEMQVFTEMPLTADQYDAPYFGSIYGRRLAQHYLMGAVAPDAEAIALDRSPLYLDWKPRDHLGLVAYGLSQIGAIRDPSRREFALASFLRSAAIALGGERLDEHEILQAMRQR